LGKEEGYEGWDMRDTRDTRDTRGRERETGTMGRKMGGVGEGEGEKLCRQGEE